MDRDRIIIGLDFGTTYTGVAFAYAKVDDAIEIITSWPRRSNVTSEKVPSTLLYEDGSIRWGFLINPEENHVRCMKLLLDESQRELQSIAGSRLDIERYTRNHGRTPAIAVSDYLRAVVDHIMETLNRRYSQIFIDNTEIRFVLTVPAVWSDKAKNLTLEAAKNAGITREIMMISAAEPEAAACYTFKNLQHCNLTAGMVVTVCDCGGGTVDLISYTIKNTNPLSIEEASVGTGGLCGAAFLDFRFEDLVIGRMGRVKYDWMRKNKPKTWQTALRDFDENVKRDFNGQEKQEFNVPFPGIEDDETIGIEDGYMILSHSDVHSIFEPTVTNVLQLIKEQVFPVQPREQKVSAIILVGGFGQSAYLFDRIKSHFQVSGIIVLQPLNAWTAIARGAVIRGLEGTVVSSRRSRCHYGIKHTKTFDSDKHDVKDRYWDSVNGTYRVSNAMKWFIEKGDIMVEDQNGKFKFNRTYRSHRRPPPDKLVHNIALYASFEDKAPAVFNSRKMLVVCMLKSDLRTVPTSRFKKTTNASGEPVLQVSYDLEMRALSADIEFLIRVNGETFGTVKAEFQDSSISSFEEDESSLKDSSHNSKSVKQETISFG